jgi:hypothetical protein
MDMQVYNLITSQIAPYATKQQQKVNWQAQAAATAAAMAAGA